MTCELELIVKSEVISNTTTDVSTVVEKIIVIKDNLCFGDGGSNDNPFEVRRVSGEDIPALVVVYEDSSGVVFILDNEDEENIDNILGVTSTSATSGNVITIKTGGNINIQGLGLTRGRVWLGSSGVLTQQYPDNHFDTLVGIANSNKVMSIDIQETIELN